MKFEIKKFLLIPCIVFNDYLCQVVFNLCWTPLLPKTLLFNDSLCQVVFDLCWTPLLPKTLLFSCHFFLHTNPCHIDCHPFFLPYILTCYLWKWNVEIIFKNHWTTTKVSKHQSLFIHVVYHNVDAIKKYYIKKYICKTQVMLVNIIFDKPLMGKTKHGKK